MDYSSLIGKKRLRFAELEGEIASPGFYDDPKRASERAREHARLKRLLEDWDAAVAVRRELAQTRELAAGEDPDLAAIASEEIQGLEREVARLDREIQYALLPRDTTEERDAIVEIRAGTGGDEASLFAGELLRMYQRYCEDQGWKLEVLEASPSGVGGFREVVFRVSGDEVFRFLKYESGVHRVQRVPATEAQGRIHTSTATVAVLPEAEEVDVELRPEDLKFEVCRSGGPGGQGVNTTDSAVQVWHLPSGLFVKCQEERSQLKNKDKALRILRAKLLERKAREEAEKYSAHRRALIGSGGREEKIRTYNFPQSRITDHRIGFTAHNLEAFLAGSIKEMVEALQASEMAERLAEAGAA
ncbi:MAG TPA: peptide chain release factor 1 [Gemmatimonadales bacterium]|nr:peptide chain release factor 1 [Gemmatimonadales bacterium]